MPNDTRDMLEKLIETCRDGETGYLHAASVAEDSELKGYFQQQSLERARFRAELTDFVKQLGEPNPDTSGSNAAVLHRAWFELKDDFGGGDHTLLESVERGEDSAKHSYESALETKLPGGIDELVRNQYGSVKAAHDHVRSRRDEKAA
ncbi:MAG TPA: PA2169 family four-helix-bundle protein [Terriglobales bacterium]|nr:PA2169 family four-helix-bundle protein [Terriglobales bacterium]